MSKQMLPALENLSPEIEALVADAIRRDHPKHQIGRMVVCESNVTAVLVRVFLPVPSMRPTPYCIYQVDLAAKRAHELIVEESSRYRIKNYK